MSKMIDYIINKNTVGIDFEELKSNDVIYSIWLAGFIRKIDTFCDLYNEDKVEVYLKIGKLLYK